MTREEAIRFAMNLRINFKCESDIMVDFCNTIIKALEQEQETKIGHWIALGNYDDYGEEQTYICSECGDIDTYHYNYCPECGAKMTDPIDTRARNKWQK